MTKQELMKQLKGKQAYISVNGVVVYVTTQEVIRANATVGVKDIILTETVTGLVKIEFEVYDFSEV